MAGTTSPYLEDAKHAKAGTRSDRRDCDLIADALCAEDPWRLAVKLLLVSKSHQDRQIVALHILQNQPLAAVAEKLGIGEARAAELHNSLRARMHAAEQLAGHELAVEKAMAPKGI